MLQMEWVKTLHVFGVVSWMAGVFYMPRLLVNLAEAHQAGEPTARLEGMAFRLFRFCSGAAVVAIAAGLWNWLGYDDTGKWLHWKLVFVVLMIAYWCMNYVYLSQMMRGEYRRSSVFFRVYNEISVLLFVPIIIFAVTKMPY